jgi:hypothetical protein
MEEQLHQEQSARQQAESRLQQEQSTLKEAQAALNHERSAQEEAQGQLQWEHSALEEARATLKLRDSEITQLTEVQGGRVLWRAAVGWQGEGCRHPRATTGSRDCACRP